MVGAAPSSGIRLYLHRRRTRSYGARVFIKGERYPYSAEGWKSAFRRAANKAGLKDYRMHDNRHTAASRLHREIGLAGVQEVLRHKQIETTRKYTHVSDQEKLEAMQRAADKAAERQAKIRGTNRGTVADSKKLTRYQMLKQPCFLVPHSDAGRYRERPPRAQRAHRRSFARNERRADRYRKRAIT